LTLKPKVEGSNPDVGSAREKIANKRRLPLDIIKIQSVLAEINTWDIREFELQFQIYDTFSVSIRPKRH
jgi:hypothetical protein